MANEIPKKPIRRTTVPAVSKETSAKKPAVKEEGKAAQNFLLFFLFLMVSAIVYLAIFQRSLISNYISGKQDSTKSATDTLSTEDSLSHHEEVNTFLGQDNRTAGTASRYYLVAGTFIFYPYAEKCRDRLKAQGYDADIISTGEKHTFHRVYIQSSEDPAIVRGKRDEMRNAGHTEMWVYGE
ncbi:MAG TPA: hypothetical protein VNB90_01650 [Cytophagaceae bacterium]|jgi:cell division protein FtsN|nr:hypothetical protein [Cytophagaceae bacterium]